MKPIAPTPPPIREDGKADPKWLTWVYATGTMMVIIMWAYIISKKT